MTKNAGGSGTKIIVDECAAKQYQKVVCAGAKKRKASSDDNMRWKLKDSKTKETKI